MRAVIAAGFISIAAPTLADPENTSWPDYREDDVIDSNAGIRVATNVVRHAEATPSFIELPLVH